MTFVEKQQKLAQDYFTDEDDGAMRMDKWDNTQLDTLITQIITNVGVELERKVRERQSGWLGIEEDGSDRHECYDELDETITIINQVTGREPE